MRTVKLKTPRTHATELSLDVETLGISDYRYDSVRFIITLRKLGRGSGDTSCSSITDNEIQP